MSARSARNQREASGHRPLLQGPGNGTAIDIPAEPRFFAPPNETLGQC